MWVIGKKPIVRPPDITDPYELDPSGRGRMNFFQRRLSEVHAVLSATRTPSGATCGADSVEPYV